MCWNDKKLSIHAEERLEAASCSSRVCHIIQHLLIPAQILNLQKDVIMRLIASES